MVNILGINISTLSRSALQNKLDDFLHSGQHYLVTVNPEIILRAHDDEEYFYVINKADLAPADGFGLVLAGLLAGLKIPRFPGSDLTPWLLEKAEKEKRRVIILNWRHGLSSKKEIEEALAKNWPNLEFLVVDSEKEVTIKDTLLKEINDFSPEIFFCGLGAPYQEKILFHNLINLPSVHLALGIGGTFDFLTKKIRRAPKFIRYFGLEWFFRIFSQPENRLRRAKRVWQATAVFAWKIFRWRFVYPWLYRPCVSCLAIRKTSNGSFEALLVERKESHGHWQFPQGGTDGESIEVAGVRELREETGLKNIKILGSLKNAHKYSFNKKDPRGKYGGRINMQRHLDYRGQKQSFLVVEVLDPQEPVKINFWDHRDYRWVPLDKVAESVHPIRKIMAEKMLDLAYQVLSKNKK